MAIPRRTKALASSDWMTTRQFARKYKIPPRLIQKAYVWGLLRVDRDVSFDLQFVHVPNVMRKEPEILLLEAIGSPTRQQRLWARPHVRPSSEDKRRMAEKILQLRKQIEELRQQLIAAVRAEWAASRAYWHLLWEPGDCPWCHGEKQGKDGKRCVFCREAS